MSLPRVRILLAAAMSSMLLASVAVAESSGGTPPGGTESTVSDPRPRFIAAAPSGTILFSSNRHAPVPSPSDTEPPDFELFAVNPDGSGLTQVTDSPGALIEPRWSPDGDSLAFVWTQDGTDSQVWTSSPDGTNLSMLRDTDGIAALSWSPDGGQLAYTDNEFVRILDVADGSDRELVEGSWPSWSVVAGSTVVVYTSGEFVGEGSDMDLRVVEPDGTNDRPILLGSSDSPSDLTNPSEASAEPGTGRIAFVASANGYEGEPATWNEQIYVVELLDGDPVRTTSPVLVSQSSTNDHWPPAWSRQSSTDDAACLVWTTDGEQSDSFTSGLVVASIGSTDIEIVELTTPGIAYDWFPDWHPDATCPTNSTR
jgi:hypothetical protein